MPTKRVAFNFDDAIRLYEAGESIDEIARNLGISRSTIRRRMGDAGYRPRTIGEATSMRFRLATPDLTEAIERYVAGETVQSLAREFGVTRRRLESAIDDAGYQRRTLREAVGLRYTRMTVAEREALTAAAHDAKRDRPANRASLERRAATMEVTLQLASRADLLMAVWLAQRGVQFTLQKAVGIYNIDIAVDEPRIAVEVNGSQHGLRHLSRNRSTSTERLNYLFDAGWRVIEVDIARQWLRPDCADRVVALIEAAREDEAPWGQHCVIRGDGEALA